jgi:hypothetical protein
MPGVAAVGRLPGRLSVGSIPAIRAPSPGVSSEDVKARI